MESWNPIKYISNGVQIDAHLKLKEALLFPDGFLNWAELFQQQHDPSLPDIKDLSRYIDYKINNKVFLWKGDITRLGVDAIVNSTNKYLTGEHGVDKCVHSAAGINLRTKLLMIPCCNVGNVLLTNGYDLPAKRIIHTVGPDSENQFALRSCYENSLRLLVENDCRSIAFPCIATGSKGYKAEPKKAARIALGIVRHFLETKGDKMDRIIFCVHNNNNAQIYLNLMQTYFPVF